MPVNRQPEIPADGLKGLVQNWRNDFIAAISVSLVALPLCLGIALASGVEPMSGIFSAIIGGLVITLFRGSHVAINGPAAGLVAVVLAAVYAMGGPEDPRSINYAMAAIVVSGVIQGLLGLFRMGKYAEMFPSSVIHGILAAIGIIIISTQLSVAMGTEPVQGNTFQKLVGAVRDIPNLNPYVTIISIASILLLIYHAKISYKLFHFLPAPMWVLVIAIPFVYWFGFLQDGTISFLGRDFNVGPHLLINIPDNPMEAILFPDFSRMHTGAFWLSVIAITLIASLETLAITKAVDKLDPYKRRSNIDKDLFANGFGTTIAGCIGGLPIIPVIVRSTVNVHNNARTRWANFYHGILLLLFVLLLAPIIQKVPLAALAAILVFTGFKLAAPRVFKHAYEQGMEQLLFLAGTVIITLFSDLLWGIIGGFALTIMVHVLLARLPIPVFFRMVFRKGNKFFQKNDGTYELKIRGIANFLSMLRLNNTLAEVPYGSKLNVDLSGARLVDLTVLENLEEFKRTHEYTGGKVKIHGMENHVASTGHQLALRSLISHIPSRLTARQQSLKSLAIEQGWTYRPSVELGESNLQEFRFFDTRPIERKDNVIGGDYPALGVSWEISDITFDEGALLATEVYRTTVQVIKLPFEIPNFILEEEGFFDKVFDRVMAFSGQRDIDFKLFPHFSKKFLLKGENIEAIKAFFTPKLIQFFENHDIYHIESNGSSLLIFKYLRLARTVERIRMVEFSKELVEKIGGGA